MNESSLSDCVKVIKNEEVAADLMRYCLRGWYMPEVLEEGELNYGKFDLQNTVEQNILANLLGYEIVRQGEEQFALKRWDESERTVMTELYYVDREYRDSYYMYYARKHSDYERFTMRIIIFKMWRRKLNSIIQSGFKDVLLAVVSSDLYRWEPSESHSFHHAIYYAKNKRTTTFELQHIEFRRSEFR